ncbi:hypothetical protein ACMHYB_01240 [Sorangium sp. So ce1128]
MTVSVPRGLVAHGRGSCCPAAPMLLDVLEQGNGGGASFQLGGERLAGGGATAE